MMSKHLLKPFPMLVVALALLVVSLPVTAHQVRHEVTRGEAVVVSMAYGNGSPLAMDRYEIYAEDEDTAFQSGNTDAEGRIVFLPHRFCVWRVRVFSEDGHGADFTFEAGPAEVKVFESDAGQPAEKEVLPDQPPVDTFSPEVVEAENKKLIERYALPVAGVGIIFGVFGLFSLFVRRRQ